MWDQVRRVLYRLLGLIFLGLGGYIMFRGAYSQSPSAPVITLGCVVAVVSLAMIWPDRMPQLTELVSRLVGLWKGFSLAGTTKQRGDEPDAAILESYSDVVGADKEPPPPDEWYMRLRPLLHQVAQYSVPTYYLDSNYYIVDWNIAFELIFAPLTNSLRGKHVNSFIIRLKNSDEVYDHAREFSQREIPLLDMENLLYDSRDYGEVRVLKVAVQLHGAKGQYRGWAVMLLIQKIHWERFQADLLARATDEKIWSVYAASYDAVLLKYSGYGSLITKVIDVAPGSGLSVADLGAGTGNTTAALLKRGHKVTAVENSYEMIDQFRTKGFDAAQVRMVKCSVQHLGPLASRSFDAVVAVNVLYAVEDPLACLQGVNRILKKGGALGLSTTHRGTELKPLLDDIKRELEKNGLYPQLADDYARVLEVNRRLEPMARRHTKEEYLDWVSKAGFEVSSVFPSEYHGTVMVIHARKVRHPEDGGP